MKIKTKTYIGVAISFFMIILTVSFSYFYTAQIRKGQTDFKTAFITLHDINELILVTNVSSFIQHDRGMDQWKLKYQKLSDKLSQSNNNPYLNTIKLELELLNSNFSKLAEEYKIQQQLLSGNGTDDSLADSQKLVNNLAEQFHQNSKNLMSQTLSLTMKAEKKVNSSTFKWIFIISLISILMSSMIIISSSGTFKRILHPLNNLLKLAKSVSQV